MSFVQASFCAVLDEWRESIKKQKDHRNIISTNIASNKIQCSSVPKQPERAHWMRNNWGVRFVIPCGDSKLAKELNIQRIVEQISSLKTPKWVQINLSLSFGGCYTSPNVILRDSMKNIMLPKRDLFGEFLREFRSKGFKIMVYFASQGPSISYFSKKTIENIKSRNNKNFNRMSIIDGEWHEYLIKNKLSEIEGVAKIVEYYSRKYKDDIDAWWFDHARAGNYISFTKAARSGNDNSSIAWNENHDKIVYKKSEVENSSVWMLTRSNSEEDFTDGHVSSTKKVTPWADGNELVIHQIEKCHNIGGIVPHYFVPLQSTWRGGSMHFPESKAIDWTLRTLAAGGGITWAAALKAPEFKFATLSQKSYKLLQSIDQAVINAFPNMLRK